MTIGLAVLVLLVFGGWYFLQGQKTTQAPSPAPAVTTQEEEEATDEAEVEDMEETQVTISSTGFMPKEVTIKVGEQVTWMHSDTKDHQINSDPHPTHTAYKPLNSVGVLKAGETKSLTFPEPGTYKYHDHLNPSLTGSVTVE